MITYPIKFAIEKMIKMKCGQLKIEHHFHDVRRGGEATKSLQKHSSQIIICRNSLRRKVHMLIGNKLKFFYNFDPIMQFKP
jgi:hypothetical protein